MKKKQVIISAVISVALYFALPEMSRLDMFSIIGTVFVAVKVLSIPVDDLMTKRRETNASFAKMRNDRPKSDLTGSNGWKMVEVPADELTLAK